MLIQFCLHHFKRKTNVRDGEILTDFKINSETSKPKTLKSPTVTTPVNDKAFKEMPDEAGKIHSSLLCQIVKEIRLCIYDYS